MDDKILSITLKAHNKKHSTTHNIYKNIVY